MRLDLIKQIDTVQQPKLNWKLAVGILAVFFVALGLILFYFFIFPSFIKKPEINKPILSNKEEITTQHIDWIVNELGIYKLHPNINGEKPQVEIFFADVNQGFSADVENNRGITTAGNASNPDVRISLDRDTFFTIFNLNDTHQGILTQYKNGNIKVQLLKDQLYLLSKGYNTLYDSLNH